MANENFLSYSHKDEDIATQIFQQLKLLDIDLWMDKDDLKAGSNWRERVDVGIRQSLNFLFLISPDSVSSPECEEELKVALNANKRIIPLVCRWAHPKQCHPALSDLQWLRLDENFGAGIRKLVTILDSPAGANPGSKIIYQLNLNYAEQFSSYYLFRSKYLIGRNPPETKTAGRILTPDRGASKVTATLTLKEDQYYLLDGIEQSSNYYPSTNGILINGSKIPQGIPIVLRSGDFVRFGTKSYFSYLIDFLGWQSPEEIDDRQTLT